MGLWITDLVSNDLDGPKYYLICSNSLAKKIVVGCACFLYIWALGLKEDAAITLDNTEHTV